MSEVTKQIIYGIIRHFVTAACGAAILHGIVTGDQAEYIATGIGAFVVAAIFSVNNKYKVSQRVLVALGMTPGTSVAQLDNVMAQPEVAARIAGKTPTA